jgi:hypothetical protein
MASADHEKEDALAHNKTLATQVLEFLQRNPACEFQQLEAECSVFTWNQLFYEVDRLSRTGQLRLIPAGNGHYSLRLTQKGESFETEIVTDHSTAGQFPSIRPSRSRNNPESSPASLAGRAQPIGMIEPGIWIAQRAYQLYEEQGRQDGHALEHWLKAEREVQEQ